MTSKNSFFKLMKEDLKRRIWNIALLFLTLLFSLVIPVAYIGGTPRNMDAGIAAWIARVTDDVLGILGGQNPFVAMIVVVGAIICGVTGFSYLHSAKKTDFYHSIPVRREQLFWTTYLNGILMMAVIYLLILLAAVVTASTFGVGFAVTFGEAMKGYFFHMAFYCLFYTTAILAMILTGNIIIALLGTTVFFFYVPMVIMLGVGYMQVWFRHFSYSDGMDKVVTSLVTSTSPFIGYIQKLDSYGEGSSAMVIMVTLLISVVLAVCACLLYRLRPSEAAGRAMAFKKSMTPIKFLLVIPMMMGFCIFFYSLRDTFAWGVFGVICGALLTHCLMEIIYHFDFRQLFSHKVHLVICIVAGIVILCGFKYDWFGYDSYLPKAGQVRSAAVHLRSMDNWVSYGDVEQDKDGDYSWKYQDGEGYVRKNMVITNPEDVIALAELGIQYTGQSEGRYENYYNYSGYIGFSVQYTLNSGRKVARDYLVKRGGDAEAVLRRIYDSVEYKEGVYPVLRQTPEETVSVNLQQYDRLEAVPDSADIEAILKAYQEELKGLTYETRLRELPIGTIQFVTANMETALMFSAKKGSYFTSYISDRRYYPLYPSFTKTFELLEEAGVNVAGGLEPEDVSMVEIYDNSYDDRDEDYSYDKDRERYYQISDMEEVKALIPALVFMDYYDLNPIYGMEEEDISVTVMMRDNRSISCILDKDKVPAFLSERLEAGRKN